MLQLHSASQPLRRLALSPAALTCLYARKNKFEGLPPALGAATGLVALDLSGCPSLRLTTSDLDSLLASMPHLRHLMLGGSMTKEGNAHLKQVAQLKQLKQDRYSL